VDKIDKENGSYVLRTKEGFIRSKKIVVATNGFYQEGLIPQMDGRVLPVISNIIVTRKLNEDELNAHNFKTFSPIANTKNLLYYYRKLPDNRILFGTRGDFEGSNLSNSNRANDMEKFLKNIFPKWSNITIDYNNYQIQEDSILEGPKQMESEFSKTLPFADKGRLILCFFAPGCDHCRAAVRSIDSLSKIVENFPKVEIVFMDEEVEKIPEFFDYAGSEYNYIVLDISTFYDVLTWERDTPGIFYMWNGNILKEFNGTNEKAYEPELLFKSLDDK